jgi:hypothetical protein
LRPDRGGARETRASSIERFSVSYRQPRERPRAEAMRVAREAEARMEWARAAGEWLSAGRLGEAATCARLELSARRGDALRAGLPESRGGPNPLYCSDAEAMEAIGLRACRRTE